MIQRRIGFLAFLSLLLGSFLLSGLFPVDFMGQPYINSSEFLIDHEGSLTLEKVLVENGLPVLDNTRPIEGGFFEGALWLKHKFKTGEARDYYFVEDHHINDSVQFWVYHEDSLIYTSNVYGARKLRRGIENGFSLGHYTEKVTLRPNEDYDVIMKIKSLFAKELSSFSIFDQSFYNQYVDRKLGEKTKIGLYGGAIGFSILFSLILFSSTRNLVFLCYAGLAGGNILSITSYNGLFGNIFTYFHWSNYNIPGLGNGITQLSLILYLYYFIPKKYLTLWYQKMAPYLASVVGVFLLAFFIIPDSSSYFFAYANMLFLVGPAMIIIMIWILIRSIQQGFSLGWWPILAHAPFMAYIIDYFLNVIISDYERLLYGHLRECTIFELIVLVMAMTQQYKNSLEEKLAVSNELNELSQNFEVKLLSSQEEERKRLAGDIHDGVLQQLLTLKLMFKKKNSEQMQEEVLEETMSDLRNLSHALMPSTIKEVGLKASLSDFLYNRAEHFQIRIRFDFQADEQRLSQDTQNHLLRICQELIQNTIKHAEAQLIDLAFHETDDQLFMIYSDNGKGFSDDKSITGIGLETIKTRTRIIGADFTFESAQDQGFSALMTLPIGKKNELKSY